MSTIAAIIILLVIMSVAGRTVSARADERIRARNPTMNKPKVAQRPDVAPKPDDSFDDDLIREIRKRRRASRDGERQAIYGSGAMPEDNTVFFHDPSETLRVLLDNSDSRARVEVTGQVLGCLGEIIKTQIRHSESLDMKTMEIAERIEERMWESRSVVRKLTLGLSGYRGAAKVARESMRAAQEAIQPIRQEHDVALTRSLGVLEHVVSEVLGSGREGRQLLQEAVRRFVQ